MFEMRLELLRKQKKYTHQDMAAKLGITRQAYSNYENGKREPDYDMLEKIADLFGVNTDYLLGRSNDPSSSEKKDKPDELANVFFHEWDKASPEKRKKTLDFIKFLNQMADEENNKE